jgi:hypothetical protein
MENGKPAYRDASIVMAHELGHARAYMTGDRVNNSTDTAALRLENKVRLLRNPQAARRKEH